MKLGPTNLIQLLLTIPKRRLCLDVFLIPILIYVRTQISIGQTKSTQPSSSKLLQVLSGRFLQIIVSVCQSLINYSISTLWKNMEFKDQHFICMLVIVTSFIHQVRPLPCSIIQVFHLDSGIQQTGASLY